MSPREKKKALSFEQATERLEEIVAKIDDTSTGLEESIALVAEGLGLISRGHKILAEAELKIRQLEVPADEENSGNEAEAKRPSRTQQAQEDNDFSLF